MRECRNIALPWSPFPILWISPLDFLYILMSQRLHEHLTIGGPVEDIWLFLSSLPNHLTQIYSQFLYANIPHQNGGTRRHPEDEASTQSLQIIELGRQ